MKAIELTQGKVVKVDDSDYLEMSKFKWYALRPTGNRNWYAARGVYDRITKRRTTVYMHKVLLGTNDYVDHINRDSLDNRRVNLRSATASQSRANSTPKGISKYMGVSWSKASNKWQSHISWGGKKKYLGLFDSEIEAARMYDTWAKTQWGEFANLNNV